LIGGKLFAIDGCKLPSNASKEWSGTKQELRKKREKLGRLIAKLISRHKKEDRQDGNRSCEDENEEAEAEESQASEPSAVRDAAADTKAEQE
jgi:hypothetical protein